jgi:hypothetical protein
MDGNGGNRALVLPAHLNETCASRLLHGGKRWLLTREDAGGPRRDLFAVREDGALHVRLTGDPTMDYWRPAWAPDEDAAGATISMFGRQWAGTTPDTVVPGTEGLYTAHLTFDGGGNVVGLDAGPVFALSLGTKVIGGQPQPDAFTYCWSPDMTKIATDNRDRDQIRVVDVASGAVLALGPGVSPDWSPDGSKIAYTRLAPKKGASYAWALQTVRPDGTGVATLLSLRLGFNEMMQWTKWSPDGAYLAYTLTTDSNYVYRVASNGSGNTNLTPDAAPGGLGFGFVLVDWR